MKKEEFLSALQERLAGLPPEDIRKSVDYYREMIDDRMEDGMSEEEAVAAVGTLDEVVSQILSDVPLSKLVKNRKRKKRNWSPWVIALLVIGSPVWASLLFAAVVTLFSLLIAFWAVLVSLVAVGVALLPVGLSAMVGGIVAVLAGEPAAVLLINIGRGLVCIGLSFVWVIACVWLIRLLWKGHKALLLWLKNRFARNATESEDVTI